MGPINAVVAVCGAVTLRRSAVTLIVGLPLTPSPLTTLIPLPAEIVCVLLLPPPMQSEVTPF